METPGKMPGRDEHSSGVPVVLPDETTCYECRRVIKLSAWACPYCGTVFEALLLDAIDPKSLAGPEKEAYRKGYEDCKTRWEQTKNVGTPISDYHPSPGWEHAYRAGWRKAADKLETSGAVSAPLQKIEVSLPSGEVRVYDSASLLREDILSPGAVSKSLKARKVRIDQYGKRAESKWSTVEKIAAADPELRSLYRPVWDCTVKYLWYGVAVGFVLKAIDTTVTLFQVDVVLGTVWLPFLAYIVLSLVPWRRTYEWHIQLSVFIRTRARLALALAALMPVITLLVALPSGDYRIFRGITFLCGAFIATYLVGFMFGGPAGMVIGTAVGHFRGSSPAVASDAEAEGRRPYILGILLPLLSLGITVVLYVWIYSWFRVWVFGKHWFSPPPQAF